MKRIKLLFIAILCMLSLSSCARTNVTMVIHKNGKVDISMLYALMDEMDEGKTDFDAEMRKMIVKGWECEPYKKDGYTGYKASISNLSFSSVADTFSSTGSGYTTNSPVIEKHGMTYTFKWMINADDNGLSDYSELVKSQGGFFDFTLQLPYEVKGSNADKVSPDGRTLTWDILEMGHGDYIYAEFSIVNDNLVFWVIIASVVLLIIIIITLKIIHKGRNAQVVETTGENKELYSYDFSRSNLDTYQKTYGYAPYNYGGGDKNNYNGISTDNSNPNAFTGYNDHNKN